jgi:hypothetical protein
MLSRADFKQLADSRERKTWRGKDLKKMTIPWTERKVEFTCSNGWTIEQIHPDDRWLEGLLMGHCMGLQRGYACGIGALHLIDPHGIPHVPIDGPSLVGRCNAAPPDRYVLLCREWDSLLSVCSNKPPDNDFGYHEQAVLTDEDYRDVVAPSWRSETWEQKRGRSWEEA